MKFHKSSSIIIITLAIIISAWFLLEPSALQTPIVNNLWTIKFIRHVYLGKPEVIETPLPSHPHAALLLAHQAMQIQDYDRAKDLLDPYIDLKDKLVLDTYAIILYLRSDYEPALQIWADLGNDKYLEYAAHDLKEKGRGDLVHIAWWNAYKVAPNVYERNWYNAQSSYANYLTGQNKLDQALVLYQELITAFPNNAKLPSEISKIYWTNNQLDLAVESIHQAVTLEPDNISYLLQAAGFQEHMGDEIKAIEFFTQILKLDPNNPQALEGIQRLSPVN